MNVDKRPKIGHHRDTISKVLHKSINIQLSQITKLDNKTKFKILR